MNEIRRAPLQSKNLTPNVWAPARPCGCYVGKASFQGEDMRMYPFFGTAVAPAGEPAD